MPAPIDIEQERKRLNFQRNVLLPAIRESILAEIKPWHDDLALLNLTLHTLARNSIILPRSQFADFFLTIYDARQWPHADHLRV